MKPASILLAFMAMAVTPTAGIAAMRLALVVGNNTSQDSDTAPLSFADDDAVRTSEVLTSLGFQTIVITSADSDTKRLYPSQVWTAPTRDNVLGQVSTMVSDAIEMKQAGYEPVLYFVFSGHGSYDAEGRGYLHLQDGRLTLRDVFAELVVPTMGVCDVVIMIDSCNADFLLHSRGSAVRRQGAPSTLRMEDYPHVGLILSTSTSGEVREWGRFLGGVFSHQVRTAIAGGADQDCDGIVTFPELAGFLSAANEGVTNPQLRLAPYIRAPLGNPEMPVSEPGLANGSRLVLDGPRPLRLTVLDSHLARFADINAGDRCPPFLVFPANGEYTVVYEGREHSFQTQPGLVVSLASLAPDQDVEVASRGTDEYLQQHLFEIPYGSRYYDNFISTSYSDSLTFVREAPRPWYSNPWGWSAAGLGVVAAAGSALAWSLALDAESSATRATYAADIIRYNQRVDDYNLMAGIGIGVAAAAMVGSVLIFVLDEEWDHELVVPEFQYDAEQD